MAVFCFAIYTVDAIFVYSTTMSLNGKNKNNENSCAPLEMAHINQSCSAFLRILQKAFTLEILHAQCVFKRRHVTAH